jgi:2-oxoglutarate dehydrogenase E2 component (dihydrolipoamide succinyltransferase)
MTEIRVPTLGESVTEATVGKWTKKVGDAVRKDETLVELETDKVAVEVSAAEDGVLSEITAAEGTTVGINALLGRIGAGGGAAAAKPAAAPAKAAAPAAAPTPAPAAAPATAEVSPAVRRVTTEAGVDPAAIPGTGKDGRVTKGDALAFLDRGPAAVAPAAASAPRATGPREERVKMTRLRQTIARRLKEAQNSAAMLTTFNDVDMGAVMDLRKVYKDSFEKRHGVRLGFMSFFVKACVAALKEIPAVNAEIDGTDLIYKNFYDVGMAVGTDKGLVVPVVRGCDELSLAGIEKEIGRLGLKARDGNLAMEDLQGATFTITNGGVYGSLMSTPILNAPQSGILGMHRIEDRPVVRNGQIVIRPMMYLALSYDHRIVDGKEAVTFLVRVKENIENPERLLLDV